MGLHVRDELLDRHQAFFYVHPILCRSYRRAEIVDVLETRLEPVGERGGHGEVERLELRPADPRERGVRVVKVGLTEFRELVGSVRVAGSHGLSLGFPALLAHLAVLETAGLLVRHDDQERQVARGSHRRCPGAGRGCWF